MLSEDVTLRIAARPAKILHLVCSREDVFRTIRFISHTWGGAGNAILPLPETEEVSDFARAIHRYNPDIIVLPTQEVQTHVTEVLKGVPAQLLKITDDELSEHVHGPNLIHTPAGSIPHLGLVLRGLLPERLPDSNLRILTSDDTQDLVLALEYGLPSEALRGFLKSQYAAKSYRRPGSVSDYVKLSLLSLKYLTPITLTQIRLRFTRNSYIFAEDELTALESLQVDSDRTMYLFLDDGVGIGSPCAFWNTRCRTYAKNKLLLPQDEFLCELESVVELLNVVAEIESYVVVCSTSREQAEDILARMRKACESRGDSAPVKVCYQGVGYSMQMGGLSWGVSETVTRVIGSDRAIRLTLPLGPHGLGNQAIIGFDADVEFQTGERLAMPSIPFSSRLLLNSCEQFHRAEQNEHGIGNLWLVQGYSVRARQNGIAGLYNPGKEVAFFIHKDEFVIEYLLRDRGFTLKPNRHTRYALGFTRRFGGFEKTLGLVRRGGANVIEALSHHRAEQDGLLPEQICSYIHRQLGVRFEDAQQMVASTLVELVAAGLVRRGVSLRCPHCDLQNWIAVGDLEEFIECRGCLEQFQLPGRTLRYNYLANELAQRFITAGGYAVLSTTEALHSIEASGYTQFGGDLSRIGSVSPIAEVDLLRVLAGRLIAAECKAYQEILDEHLEVIIQSLERTVEAAAQIRADVAILGVVTKRFPNRLFEEVQRVAKTASERGIGVHLIMNGMLHLAGGIEPIEPGQVSVEHLLARQEVISPERSVGEERKTYGFGARFNNLKVSVLNEWDVEFSSFGSEAGPRTD